MSKPRLDLGEESEKPQPWPSVAHCCPRRRCWLQDGWKLCPTPLLRAWGACACPQRVGVVLPGGDGAGPGGPDRSSPGAVMRPDEYPGCAGPESPPQSGWWGRVPRVVSVGDKGRAKHRRRETGRERSGQREKRTGRAGTENPFRVRGVGRDPGRRLAELGRRRGGPEGEAARGSSGCVAFDRGSL